MAYLACAILIVICLIPVIQRLPMIIREFRQEPERELNPDELDWGRFHMEREISLLENLYLPRRWGYLANWEAQAKRFGLLS